MAVLKVFVAGKDIDWGQPQAVLPTDYGIITDMKEAISADKEEIPDGNGEAAGQVFYNGKKTFDCTIIYKPAAILPAIGDKVTVDGNAGCLVESVGKETGNKMAKKVTMQFVKYVNIS
jgi:hypothetical protein